MYADCTTKQHGGALAKTLEIRCQEEQNPPEESPLGALDPPPVDLPPCAPFRVEAIEKEAFNCLRQALHLFKSDEVMVSFNGGKDCGVLLHLVAKLYSQNACLKHITIPVLFIEVENTFKEIEAVLEECQKRYNIRLIRSKGSIKTALQAVVDQMPQIKAVFMGCRRSDPHCQTLLPMQPTDPDWPPLMRINPLLEWSYTDIWKYILVRKVPYCKLYEQGYSSLGNGSDTTKNPHLRIIDPETQAVTYLHAAELQDPSHERDGRK